MVDLMSLDPSTTLAELLTPLLVANPFSAMRASLRWWSSEEFEDGEAHDCPVAERLIRRTRPPKRMLGDKAYDSAELREDLDEHGTKPVIPNRCNRKQPFSFSKRLYKLRWRIENAFNRLKDFRRIATRYDRLARNYLASVCLVAALVWWV